MSRASRRHSWYGRFSFHKSSSQSDDDLPKETGFRVLRAGNKKLTVVLPKSTDQGGTDTDIARGADTGIYRGLTQRRKRPPVVEGTSSDQLQQLRSPIQLRQSQESINTPPVSDNTPQVTANLPQTQASSNYGDSTTTLPTIPAADGRDAGHIVPNDQSPHIPDFTESESDVDVIGTVDKANEVTTAQNDEDSIQKSPVSDVLGSVSGMSSLDKSFGEQFEDEDMFEPDVVAKEESFSTPAAATPIVSPDVSANLAPVTKSPDQYFTPPQYPGQFQSVHQVEQFEQPEGSYYTSSNSPQVGSVDSQLNFGVKGQDDRDEQEVEQQHEQQREPEQEIEQEYQDEQEQEQEPAPEQDYEHEPELALDPVLPHELILPTPSPEDDDDSSDSRELSFVARPSFEREPSEQQHKMVIVNPSEGTPHVSTPFDDTNESDWDEQPDVVAPSITIEHAVSEKAMPETYDRREEPTFEPLSHSAVVTSAAVGVQHLQTRRPPQDYPATGRGRRSVSISTSNPGMFDATPEKIKQTNSAVDNTGKGQKSAYVERLRKKAGVTYTSKDPPFNVMPVAIRSKSVKHKRTHSRQATAASIESSLKHGNLRPKTRMLASEIDDSELPDSKLSHDFAKTSLPTDPDAEIIEVTNQLKRLTAEPLLLNEGLTREDSVKSVSPRMQLFVANPDE